MGGDGYLRYADAGQQERLVTESVHDSRPSLPTGYDSLDFHLRRGGILAGNLVILGGRTGTRKSTLMDNIMVNMARAGISVGLVGLDEQPWLYAAKLMSVWSGQPVEYIEEMWDEEEGRALRKSWREFARSVVHLFTGRRPGTSHLDAALEMAVGAESHPPQVLFIDYLKLLTRSGQFAFGDASRIPQLVEELQVWSTENDIAVVVLHQLSRNDEFGGTNNRNAGHLPVTLSQLMWGTEDSADLVLGTYRPTLNPIANMSIMDAKTAWGDRFDEDEYFELKALARKTERSTFVQLLKNRPGTRTEPKGIELLSPTDSLQMVEALAGPERRPEKESERVDANRT